MRTYFPGRGALVMSVALLVSGCAVPVPLQIASWAFDGFSYLTTQKSLTDHALSLVTHEDCALLRGIQGENICDSTGDTASTAVAALDGANDPTEASGDSVTPDQPMDVGVLETASGPDEGPAPAPAPVAAAVVTLPVPLAQAVAPAALAPVAVPLVVATVAVTQQPAAQRILIAGQRTWSGNADANLYFVVGSFHKRGNAKRLMKRLDVLGPSVMASRVKGVETFRVAVGPFTRAERKSVKRAVRKAGMKDAWAIRINHSQWMIVNPTLPGQGTIATDKLSVAETASLPVKSGVGS